MPHKPWKLLLYFWTTSLALAMIAVVPFWVTEIRERYVASEWAGQTEVPMVLLEKLP